MAYFKRSDWGARQPRSRSTVSPSSRTEFVVHYAAEEEDNIHDCAAAVRGIQNYHMDGHGWADIAYNFLVCNHGDVFEGRGWDVIGAHSPNHNTIGIGICFLGDDDPNHQDASPAARAALKAMADNADIHCSKKLSRVGHKDTQKPGYTSCPGEELHTWVHAGMPLDGDVPVGTIPNPHPQPAPAPAPTPAPQPTPAPSTEPDWTGAMIMNLPTLKTGSKGEAVKRIQGLLYSFGFGLTVDGDFGAHTDSAVKTFQAHLGLVSDGIVGQKTWRALIGA